jgi:hypothetical protein
VGAVTLQNDEEINLLQMNKIKELVLKQVVETLISIRETGSVRLQIYHVPYFL